MARKPNVFPSYLRHSSGQARIRVNGRDILLGVYGSDESRIKYGQLIAKLAGGVPIDPLADSQRGKAARRDPEADPGPTVGELCLAFLRHAETHHIMNGVPTSEVCILKSVIRPLNELFGLAPGERLRATIAEGCANPDGREGLDSESATAVARVRLDSVPILIEDLRQALVREDYPAARSQAENLTRWLKAVESSMIAATGP